MMTWIIHIFLGKEEYFPIKLTNSFFVHEAVPPNVAQADLKLTILLPQFWVLGLQKASPQLAKIYRLLTWNLVST
jgi:hypothetical protein